MNAVALIISAFLSPPVQASGTPPPPIPNAPEGQYAVCYYEEDVAAFCGSGESTIVGRIGIVGPASETDVWVALAADSTSAMADSTEWILARRPNGAVWATFDMDDFVRDGPWIVVRGESTEIGRMRFVLPEGEKNAE